MARAKIRGLDCSAPAEKMIPVVLRAQLKAMCATREQALNWKDPEGVHDMRVLSRRLRSTISDFRPYLRKGSLPRPKLRAIAGRLGAVRDEDVALMALEELKSTMKRAAIEGIVVLAKERKTRRKRARAALKTALAETAVEEFRKDFLASLRNILIAFPKESPRPETTETGPTFSGLGIQVVKARAKDFIAASSHLYTPYEINELHNLRILAKRLRYSIELFAVCWNEELAAMAKEVALMQTSLGELHDCDVWIADLGKRLKRDARKASLETDERKVRTAATKLLKHFAAKRTEHYRDALARWEQWQADGFLDQLGLALDRERSAE